MEKFREYITLSGTKILAGKNKEQNEELVKSFKGKNNTIMHTEKPGSPFCIITGKSKKGDKKECALLCAKKSQDWRDNKKDVVVHVFTGKDVYKRKTMPIGTYGVKRFKKIKIKKIDIEKWRQ